MQITDQVNRKTKRENDSLGRLIKVTEQDVTTGNLTQDTTYAYDIADHLIGVNQGNQTRAFKYDAEGHLLFERIPEMTATINDGTGTYWTTKYTYTDFGSVATKTDPRGVIITYGYDNLNRLTSISYNTSGAPGVASTPSATYNYDTNQSSSTNGLLLSITVGSGYSESYGYDAFKRVQSVARVIDGRNYTTSFQFDTANQLTQMTYPSNRVVNIGHDSKGRVTSVGSYLNSVTYDGIGRLSGTTLGNAVTEGFGYDANRMQLTSQTATKNGGPTNGLMNLTYSYDAATGQMGAGSTAGNAGQLMSTSGTINQTTESAAYTYDDLGRLVTSNQTSNGSSAQRRFAYDRWGNRTGAWDAVSGGTQIQSIALQQSGGAPTNQIQSVTSGSTVNYTYDATGNVTNDGAHGFTYDAENRIVSVDSGSTATYAYDPSNQRYKKTVGSTVTHYIWQGSLVIAEHNGSTGTSIADYVYSGSQMIAKVAGLTTQYFLSDRLSERLMLNTSGAVLGRQGHLPFGEDFAESGTQEKHHLTSYERDGESATDYAVNRQYSPNVGRFLRVDPRAGSIGNPQSLDRYSYVKNDPIQLTDPLGLGDGFVPNLGSSAGWDLTWLYYFSGWFPLPNIDPGPPNPGPSIPVATIPTDACDMAIDLFLRRGIDYYAAYDGFWSFAQGIADHLGSSTGKTVASLMSQFNAGRVRDWAAVDSGGIIVDPSEFSQMGSQMGQAYLDGGGRYLRDFIHFPKYEKRLILATQGNVRLIEDILQKCQDRFKSDPDSQAFWERERTKWQHQLTFVQNFMSALQAKLDGAPE